MSDRGSSLLEVLILGFAVVLLVGQALIALVRLEMAGSRVSEVAERAALVAARHGGATMAGELAEALVPEGRVIVTEGPSSISVVIEVDVSLIGPDTGPLTRTVTGRAEARRSPYRSG